ncbi:Sec-independent protein translocase subunit TatA [Streptomyces sp. NPDC056061]|uniref:Sec-independent protein translocase subunit TatA n=1 Tax=Streptomyces sp. NPDC056061 TaxID=3345700 RepID=UPI0035E2315D
MIRERRPARALKKRGVGGVFRNALEPWHLLILVLVIVVVFGSKKLPDSARALGKSLRILKSETRAMKEEGAPTPGPASSDSVPSDPAASGGSEAVSPSVRLMPGTPEGGTSRSVRSAPGDAASARPVRENGTEPR